MNGQSEPVSLGMYHQDAFETIFNECHGGRGSWISVVVVVRTEVLWERELSHPVQRVVGRSPGPPRVACYCVFPCFSRSYMDRLHEFTSVLPHATND
jgi:hypothetical protein